MLPRNHPDHNRIVFDDRRLVANAGLLLPAPSPGISACPNSSGSTSTWAIPRGGRTVNGIDVQRKCPFSQPTRDRAAVSGSRWLCASPAGCGPRHTFLRSLCGFPVSRRLPEGIGPEFSLLDGFPYGPLTKGGLSVSSFALDLRVLRGRSTFPVSRVARLSCHRPLTAMPQ